MSPELRFLVAALVTWRLTYFLTDEDGPWGVVIRLRVALGESIVGRAMDCFFCASVWIAAPVALWVVESGWLDRVVVWVGLSGAASLAHFAKHERTPVNTE